ncbi:unnamed protein product [Bursaphelenchus okinawaensis]|uniref:Uncharacterized protein n=1 Tax=Bursaphelenchus okinawaensis TaxID=465554 RepID=A0A811K293_9BILA|nr:unnamed protein product [Bursaphelenchus okinawaensis]CAG9090575.1 unnamed protein product [Bursaphelenchus okinawaensis]
MALPVFKLGIQDYFGPICAFCWFLGGLWLIAILIIRPFYINAEELQPARKFYFRKRKKVQKDAEDKPKDGKKSKTKSAKSNKEKPTGGKSTKETKSTKEANKSTKSAKKSQFEEVSAGGNDEKKTV